MCFLKDRCESHHNPRNFVDSSTGRGVFPILTVWGLSILTRGAVKCMTLHLWAVYIYIYMSIYVYIYYICAPNRPVICKYIQVCWSWTIQIIKSLHAHIIEVWGRMCCIWAYLWQLVMLEGINWNKSLTILFSTVFCFTTILFTLCDLLSRLQG